MVGCQICHPNALVDCLVPLGLIKMSERWNGDDSPQWGVARVTIRARTAENHTISERSGRSFEGFVGKCAQFKRQASPCTTADGLLSRWEQFVILMSPEAMHMRQALPNSHFAAVFA